MLSSNELFINMKPNDIPHWKRGVSFYDQEPSVIQFWLEEQKKFTEGVNIGGYFFHPWLYFHINFYKTPIPNRVNGEIIDVIQNPKLDDNILYAVDTYQEASEKGLGMCLFGSRGVAKSTILSSNVHWTMSKSKYGGRYDISGGSQSDLNDIYNLITTSITNAVDSIRLPILKSDSSDGIYLGMRPKTGQPYDRGRINIKNLVSGRTNQSEKGAGGTPIGAILDEIGKFDPRDYMGSFLPSRRSQFGSRFVHILAGTGGNTKLSTGAKHILENPKAYDLLMMNFDRLDRSVPEEYITWKGDRDRSFATFFPAQMSYRLDSVKEKNNLKDFVSKFDDTKYGDELKDIEIYETNWENATKEISILIENKSTIEEKNKERMYYPTCIDDCFLTRSNNPFPSDRCLQIKTKLESDRAWRAGFLERGVYEDGIVFKMDEEAPIAKRKYENVAIDSPILFYEDIPDGYSPKNTIVSGLDDYNLAQAKKSDSLGAFYGLRRRNVGINTPIEQIVFSYATRPPDRGKFHNQMELCILKFNALCCMESINTEFISYFINTGKEPDDFLVKAFSPAAEVLNKKGKASGKTVSKYGIYPNQANITYILNRVIKYANEEVVIGVDENGNKIVKLGVDFIPDPMLLQEMIDFSITGGNYDRIMAFGQALVYAEWLDKYNVLPEDDEDEIIESNKSSYNSRKIKFNNFGSPPTNGNKKLRFKNF